MITSADDVGTVTVKLIEEWIFVAFSWSVHEAWKNVLLLTGCSQTILTQYDSLLETKPENHPITCAWTFVHTQFQVST